MDPAPLKGCSCVGPLSVLVSPSNPSNPSNSSVLPDLRATTALREVLSCWPVLDSKLAHLGPPDLHFRPSCPACPPLGTNLAPTWAQLGPTWLHTGPTWPQHGPNLAPTWPNIASTWLEHGTQNRYKFKKVYSEISKTAIPRGLFVENQGCRGSTASKN